MISTSERQHANTQIFKKALVVLGMHRSGTSALTRVLSLCGASLPKRLIPPKANDNEAGFWEPSQIGKIHDQLLASSGSFWHDFSPFPIAWYSSTVAQEFKEQIILALQEDFADSSLFVIKDPRVCRIVPFWLDLLEEFDAKPSFLIPIRHPLEVAASLKKRDGFGLAKSLLLWLQHFLAAEKDTRNLPRSFSSYDKLLVDWQGVVSQIETDLQISFPRRSHSASVEIDEFLRFDLRHHHEKLDDLSVRSDIANWVAVAFNWAIRASNGDAVSSDELDAIYSAFQEADKAYGPIIAQANREVSKYQSQIIQLNEFSEKIDNQEQLIETQKQKIIELIAGITDKEQAITQFTTELAAKEQLVIDLSAKLETQEHNITELTSRLSEQEQLVIQLTTELATKDQLVADFSTKLETQQQNITELSTGLEDREQLVTQLSTELEEKGQLIANLGTKLRTQEQTVIELITELGNREREIDHLETKLKTQEQDITHLSTNLREQQQIISNLETNLKNQQQETLRWTQAFQSQEQEITNLKTNITATEQEISTLKKQLEIRDSRIIEFESAILKRDRRIEKLELEASRLKGQVEIETKTRKQEVTHLETKLKNKEQQITQLNNQLKNKEQESVRLSNEIQSRKQEITQLNTNITSKDDRIGKFESGLLKRDRRIENLEMETFRLTREVGQIKASPAWKIIVQVKSLGTPILQGTKMLYWAATLQLPRKLREEKAYHLIAQSGFFDTDYYLLTYPGVAEKGLDPIRHFLNYYHEGRNPNPNFDTNFYLRYNPDVAQANMNPLIHYIRYGQSEQRATKP